MKKRSVIFAIKKVFWKRVMFVIGGFARLTKVSWQHQGALQNSAENVQNAMMLTRFASDLLNYYHRYSKGEMQR